MSPLGIIPDGIVSLHSDPVGNEMILLQFLDKLGFDLESLYEACLLIKCRKCDSTPLSYQAVLVSVVAITIFSFLN